MNFKKTAFACFALPLLASAAIAQQVPENIVVENIPSIPAELKNDLSRYLEFRFASFQGWSPEGRQMLITTRFAEASQLHLVERPGGARKQLTFTSEPVSGGKFQPKEGGFVVFSQDVGGGEFYQLYRLDLSDGKITLLTDGKSRNTDPLWARSGKKLAYTSTRRNGSDTDLYLIDPSNPKTDRLLVELKGGGWQPLDWSHDDASILLLEYISINESYLHLVNPATGEKKLLTPKTETKISYGRARFSADGASIFVTSDEGSEFQQLARWELNSNKRTALTGHIPWDVDEFEVSPNGQWVAFVTNEKGAGVLHLLDARTGKEHPAPKLPTGVPSGLDWHENNQDLGFTLTSARSPLDAWSVNIASGKVERWTESETGGLNAKSFAEPELVQLRSFDDLEISGFVYRPDPARFPGKRPVMVLIHGGPEAQYRPGFMARYNYFINELGVAILAPNVRGSAGYGKTFLTLDNGFKREDSVKDIDAFLRWIQRDPKLDAHRIAVIGGSYGGYMSLACMVHFGDQLRAGIDRVGISNFVTFLRNTQDYRRDLRRVEYGDERDPKMLEFLEKISPTAHVTKIKKPLLVVQGKNDPRVPVTESEQMVKAIRENGGTVWYLMAKDEGHGFAKKKNSDFEFLVIVQFVREHLLG